MNKAQLDAVASATTAATAYFKANGANDGSDDAVASGADSTAAGAGSVASGDGSTALGTSSLADADGATAVGFVNTASGVDSSAFGNFNLVVR